MLGKFTWLHWVKYKNWIIGKWIEIQKCGYTLIQVYVPLLR